MTRPLAALIALYLASESRLPAPAAALTLLLALLAAHSSTRARWALLTGALGAELLLTTWQAANHLFVLTYMAAIAAICPDDEDERAQPARLLFIVIMGMATIQKAASARYMSGEYFYYMIYRGGFLEPLWTLIPRLGRPALLHQHALSRWELSYPGAPLILGAGPWLLHAARAFAWMSLAAEAALTALALRASDARSARHLQLAALAFLPALVFIRPEFLFAATLAALTRWCAPQAPARTGAAHDLLWLALTAAATLSAASKL